MQVTFNRNPLDKVADHFSANTNWVVITGAPSAGKSSVLQFLAELGYTATPEIARVLVENQDKDTNVRGDEAAFQRMVTNKKLELEKSLNVNDQIFIDRGMPDSATYYRVAGLDPNEVTKDCLHFRYRKVFFFERLELHKDGVRNEDDATSEFIQHWLEVDYRAFGYEVIRVPVMSIELRAKLILSNLEKK